MLDLPAYLQQLYEYHYWANNRYLTVAQTLSTEQLHHQHGQGWGSVQGTLIHMMNAERLWLHRWRGKPGELSPPFYELSDLPTVAALRERWSAIEQEMRAFIAQQTVEALHQEITYTSTLGQSYCLTLWQMAAHMPNHATHHRGELATMFTALGVPHPEEEIVHYYLQQSGQR